MHVICLKPLAPGVYNDHKADHITAPPDGWAYIPEDFPLPSTFPRLGSIKAEELTYTRETETVKTVTRERAVVVLDENGIPKLDEMGDPLTTIETYTEEKPVTETVEYTMMTVTAMTEGTLPDAPPITPAQQREEAYNTQKSIFWEGNYITVTEAAQLWQYYAAEGNKKAEDLQRSIAYAKADIRDQYPG
jgi:hypothetical protein